MAGALTYGELCAVMPRAGGEYVFMREAYGPLWGFLFGWMRFFIGTGGGNAALAAGFAIFLNVVSRGALRAHAIAIDVPGLGPWHVGAVEAVAIGAVATVTFVNCASVSLGGRIVSVLSTLKVALVAGVGIAAFVFGEETGRISAVGGGWCVRRRAGDRPRRVRRVRRGHAGGAVGVQRLERNDLRRR